MNSAFVSSDDGTFYPNLAAEISRSGKSHNFIAAYLGIHRNTFENKLYHRYNSKFTIDEVEKLFAMFPGTTYEYLFAKRKEK